MDNLLHIGTVLVGDVSTAGAILAGVLFVIFGAANLFAGYRIFLVLFAIFAVLIGLTLGAELGGKMAGTAGSIIGAILGGILFLMGSRFLYYFNVFLVGSIIGTTLALAAIGEPTGAGTAGIVFLAWLVGGFLALMFERAFIICGTANLGALFILVGGGIILKYSGLISTGWPTSSSGGAVNPFPLLRTDILPVVLWLALFVVGAAVQFKYTATEMHGRREDRESSTHSGS